MPSSYRTAREGLIVGLIAYAAVALFYAAFDVLAARGALYTVNVLGLAVFMGLRDPAGLGLPARPDISAIVWYNALHLVASLIIGVIVTRLLAEAERRPSQAMTILFVIVCGFVVTITAVGMLSAPIRAVLPWWSIVMANSFAVLLAGAWLLRQHPDLWHRFIAQRS